LIADYEAQKIIKAEDINLPIAYYRYKIYGGENTSKQIDFYFLNMLKMEFLDALRDAQKELVSQNDYRLLNRVLRNKAEDSNTFKDLKDQIDNLNINISKDNDVKKLKDELSKMLKAISLNESETPVNFKFSAFDASELFKRLSLFYGDDEINIEKNGLGKNNLLYIALVLSHLEKLDEENRKVFFRLITIEEPEAHLHPHLQKHLSTKLDKQICENYNTDKCKEREGCDKRYMEKQIIVTSHSTHVTSHLPLKNTAILFDDKNKVKAHYILDGFGTDTESENHIRYLKKYLSATNSTMFFARKIILVEGISEQILIPKFYELKTGNSLEKDGITLLNVNGIAFKHFLEIINNGYYKKCLVITDSDEGTRTEERAETLKKEYEEKNKNLFCIKKTEKQTYEIDILQFNTGESEKKIIFNTLEATCPSLLKGYKKTHNDEMNVEELFKLIYNNENPKRNYKSEFAFNLSENLTKVFKVPEYIREGFKFLEE
jgi:predicted ATP-dependent endonuclease of OLD family